MGTNRSAYVAVLRACNSLKALSPTQPMSPAMAATTIKVDSSLVPIFKS